MKSYKILFLYFFIFTGYSYGQDSTIKILSWNLKDFGQSKNTGEIAFIAKTVKDYDVVAVQEVVAGYGGSQAVARLASELNQLGTKWDYTVSEPTFGDSYKTERYAFLWKTARVKKIGKAWLEEKFKVEIDREPYYATFIAGAKTFTLVNFHAITKSKQPETEIKYFKYLPENYPGLDLIFCGDFNLPQSHTVFNPLRKMGYQPALQQQKTSLKMECRNDDCLSSEYDNFFYNSALHTALNAGIIPFYIAFEDLKTARLVSDHVPVWMQF